MSDLPDNVDLQWLGRQLIALRDDVAVMAAILRRIENNQVADRAEWRRFFDSIRHLRERIEKTETP